MYSDVLFEDVYTENSPLTLESGQTLGPITVAYETYGTLNADKSNAILVCHTLTGDSHAAFKRKGDSKKKPWWDFMIGPGKPIDTDKFFVISPNVLGGCSGTTGPGSIDPKTGKPYGLSFPVITIEDMTEVQRALVDALGIDSLYAVCGPSMGGMQCQVWAARYPDRVQRCLFLATTAKSSTLMMSFSSISRDAIMTDTGFHNGNYYGQDTQPDRGLSLARMMAHISYLSDLSMEKKFGRKLQEKSALGYEFQTEFQIESYLKYQGNKFVTRFDANTYLYLTKALSYFDLESKFGSLKKAFKKTNAKFLVISVTSDWLYPARHSKYIVNALMNNGKDVTYCSIDDDYGHDTLFLENEQFTQVVKAFLENS